MTELPWERLFAAATEARERAYAPYSKFPVGAAVLTEDGTVFSGCNVENSSYGLSMCAERNAIGRAIAEGRKKVLAVAIVAQTPEPCPPCGACRQVISEFAEPQAPIRSRGTSGTEASYTVDSILPHAFDRSFL